jgi:hypothetical protein
VLSSFARFNSAINFKMTVFRNVMSNTCWHLCPLGKGFYRPWLRAREEFDNLRDHPHSLVSLKKFETFKEEEKKREKSLNEMDQVKALSCSPVDELFHNYRNICVCTYCALFLLMGQSL